MEYAPTYKPVEVEKIHRIILQDAADYANRFAVMDDQLPEIIGGGPFTEAPERTRRGGLTLAIDPLMTTLAPGKLARLHEHGREGVRQALFDNQDLFVGLIIGHAREGVNYFDRFGRPGDQGKLF